MSTTDFGDPNLRAIKIVLGGRWGTGKTSIRRKYLAEHRFKRNYLPTIGSDFAFKDLKVDNKEIRILIWDLAGEVRFRKFRSLYFQGASGALLVFDLTDRSSFDNLDEWALDLKNETSSGGVPLMILGNKVDLILHESEKCATKSEIESKVETINNLFEEKYPVQYVETSALSGKNIESSFMNLIKNIVNVNHTEISR